uniref:Myomesin 3 n=1 Tax=Hucho hucho TaxID=62062 RepID=A0A4W5MLC7_9TELE
MIRTSSVSQGVGVCTVCTFANRPFLSGFLTGNLLVLWSNRDVLKETMAADEQGLRTGEKWTLFGNEAEKVEVEVLREQHYVRQRCDRMAEQKASIHLKYLEDLSHKAPDFPIPLRAHMVWEGMGVKLSCTIQGCPPPRMVAQTHESSPFPIPRCSVEDAGEYKVVAKSSLGEATTIATLVVNCKTHTQECNLPSTGVQLRQSSRVELQTALRSASLTLKGVHKEQEGMYMVRLRTWEGVKEHKAYIFVKDASAVVSGGPGSPLALKVSDVQKDYVFLTWEPPSADGAYQVEGYFLLRKEGTGGQWVRCNDTIQKACHYPVRGLSDSTIYQFRVCAVNQAGVGRPSKGTEPVDRGREITITKDQLESQMKVPFPPTGVHVCEVSDNYAVLSWTEPEPRGKEQLTFYVDMDITVGSPRFPMFDLQKGNSYCFRVRSVNKFGVSEPSEPSLPISLGQPQATSVLAIRDTDSAVLLQWQEPNEKEGILGYYLYYSEAGKQEWRTVNNKPTTNTKFTVHGLKSKKEYVFRVKSVGQAGNSIYSNESPPILVKAALIAPSPSSAIALLLCTGSEMILTWRAPANNGGDPVRGYYLDQKDKELDAWSKVNTKPAKERQHKVCNLDGGHYYQFRVFAANVVGVGKPSEPSEAFLCEEWTMPEPGCPYDLEFREVRHNSLVLLWAVPLYEGQQGPITGYLVELSEGDQSQSWTAVNEEPIADTFLKVTGLQAGQTYRLRVCAFNKAGMGIPSLPSELIRAQTQPGTRDIEIGVDNDGFIFLAFEATEITEKSTFVWSKNYKKAIEAGRASVLWENNRSILTFTNATKEDLGLYTAEMSDNPNISSSFTFTAEGTLYSKLKKTLIALRSKWQVEVSEKGNVRLWMQTESLSNAAELRLILNDREISSTAAHKINFDKASGLIEILFDQLSKDDEGSYTAQLCDGRAKNQFTLVLVDESESIWSPKLITGMFILPNRAERNQAVMRCFYIRHSFWNLTFSSICGTALSAGPVRIQCTAMGFKLYCSLKYYISYMKTSWHFKESRIDQLERCKPGSSMQKLWVEVFAPTENDKGKYTLEMFDGQEKHTRSLDLSGQVNVLLVALDRARVTKGLPDVVAIMENKSLCLTCFTDGDPAPEMFWLRNDKGIVSGGQFNIANENKCSTLTVNNVTSKDTGNYSIFVRNQYGTQTVNVTVSVYKHGEKPPCQFNVFSTLVPHDMETTLIRPVCAQWVVFVWWLSQLVFMGLN